MRELSKYEIENVSGGSRDDVVCCFSSGDLFFIGLVGIAIAFSLWLCHEH